MPGKLWSRQEKKLLRRQMKARIPLANVVVAHRTTDGIAYELRKLKLYPTSRWTRDEMSRLRRESKAGKPPWNIVILGRSSFGVRNKMLRLKLWKPKPHPQKPWMRSELNRVKHLVLDCGYTARQTVANGYFPGRGRDSVAQQMRRSGWKRIASQVARAWPKINLGRSSLNANGTTWRK
jgi:hypothetical protein